MSYDVFAVLRCLYLEWLLLLFLARFVALKILDVLEIDNFTFSKHSRYTCSVTPLPGNFHGALGLEGFNGNGGVKQPSKLPSLQGKKFLWTTDSFTSTLRTFAFCHSRAVSWL